MDSETKTLIDIRREIMKQAAKLEQMIAFRACPFTIGGILVSKQPKHKLRMSNTGQKAVVRSIRFSSSTPYYTLNLQWLGDDGEPIQGNWADFVLYDWERA